MNIIIYTLVILTIFYLLIKNSQLFLQKNFEKCKNTTYYRFIFISNIICYRRSLSTHTSTYINSIALLKLKGLSIFQLISLFRLIQTLRNSGRFSFNNMQTSNRSSLTIDEAYKILNLDRSKKVTKDEVKKAYTKIQKKIHPDVSPETSRLSAIVNEAKELVLSDIS